MQQKDVMVQDIGAANVDADSMITMGVFQYNGGPPEAAGNTLPAQAPTARLTTEAVVKVTLAEWRIIAAAVEKAGIL